MEDEPRLLRVLDCNVDDGFMPDAPPPPGHVSTIPPRELQLGDFVRVRLQFGSRWFLGRCISCVPRIFILCPTEEYGDQDWLEVEILHGIFSFAEGAHLKYGWEEEVYEEQSSLPPPVPTEENEDVQMVLEPVIPPPDFSAPLETFAEDEVDLQDISDPPREVTDLPAVAQAGGQEPTAEGDRATAQDELTPRARQEDALKQFAAMPDWQPSKACV